MKDQYRAETVPNDCRTLVFRFDPSKDGFNVSLFDDEIRKLRMFLLARNVQPHMRVAFWFERDPIRLLSLARVCS